MVNKASMRRWMLATSASACIVLFMTVLLGSMGAQKACLALPYDIPPIMAFELARTPADLAALFGTSPSPCQVQMIRAFDRINSLDYLFMPAYGIMLFSFIAALASHQRSALVKLALAASIIAPTADAVENVALLAITKNLTAPEPWLAWLPYPVHLKLLCMTCAGAGAGVLLWRRGRLWLRVAGLLFLPQLVPAIVTILAPVSYSTALLTPLIGLAWGLTLLFAILGSLRPEIFRPAT